MDCTCKDPCPWNFPDENMEWVAISYSRGSFRPGVLPESPALAGGFFTTGATWEALYDPAILLLDNFTKEK